MRLCAALLTAALAADFAYAQGAPAYEQAITARFAVPGLDDGFIPQGLTFTSGDLWVSGYLWPLPGPQACRLYRLDLKGSIKATYTIPSSCSHAGGLAEINGRLFVSDTRRLIEVDPARVSVSGGVSIRRVWPLIKPVEGSFLTARNDELWIGVYATKGAPRVWRAPLAALDALPDGAGLSELQTSGAVMAPLKSQGAAFSPNGALWISQSGQTFGTLSVVEPSTGAVRAQYIAPTGIEGVTFDQAGALWAVSETGSRRWAKAARPFPFIYRIDPTKLVAAPK